MYVDLGAIGDINCINRALTSFAIVAGVVVYSSAIEPTADMDKSGVGTGTVSSIREGMHDQLFARSQVQRENRSRIARTTRDGRTIKRAADSGDVCVRS